jgi:hypothetical protein
VKSRIFAARHSTVDSAGNLVSDRNIALSRRQMIRSLGHYGGVRFEAHAQSTLIYVCLTEFRRLFPGSRIRPGEQIEIALTAKVVARARR